MWVVFKELCADVWSVLCGLLEFAILLAIFCGTMLFLSWYVAKFLSANSI